MHALTGGDAMSANVWRRKDLLLAFKLQASENLTAAVLMFGISPHPNVYHSKLERSFYQRCTVEVKAVSMRCITVNSHHLNTFHLSDGSNKSDMLLQ